MNLDYLQKECDALTGFFKQGFEKALEILKSENPSDEDVAWANTALDCISKDCNTLLDKEKFNQAIK